VAAAAAAAFRAFLRNHLREILGILLSVRLKPSKFIFKLGCVVHLIR
jgi:hypothetical protein